MCSQSFERRVFHPLARVELRACAEDLALHSPPGCRRALRHLGVAVPQTLEVEVEPFAVGQRAQLLDTLGVFGAGDRDLARIRALAGGLWQLECDAVRGGEEPANGRLFAGHEP
jgi:hypothetical protein